MTAGAPATAPAPPMAPRPFRVVSKQAETPDTISMVLTNVDGEEVDFEPGQFMMVYALGVGEVPISISGNPRVGGDLEHTIRAVGAVTRAICALDAGDVVGARGPFGTSWPVSAAANGDLLIVAGGIGLAPLRPAVMEAMHRRDEINSLSLIYGARTPTDLLYKDDLLGWESSKALNVEVTVDRASSEWWGDVGLVTNLLPRVPFNPAYTTAFVCGPEVMMRVVARELVLRGVAAERIHISMERNMKCGVGLCGHCQYGSSFLCVQGPVGSYAGFADRLTVDEI